MLALCDPDLQAVGEHVGQLAVEQAVDDQLQVSPANARLDEAENADPLPALHHQPVKVWGGGERAVQLDAEEGDGPAGVDDAAVDDHGLVAEGAADDDELGLASI